MDHQPPYIVPDSLVAENIFVSAGLRDILRGVTIRADKGKITGLLGRNGSGKTTMLQAIFGTRRHAECDVFLNGSKIFHPYSINGIVNYLPQKPFLPNGLRISEALKQYAADRQMILDYFPEIEPDLDAKAGELSGGRLRLISVLLILFAKTRFSFLDEPFSHIMPLHLEPLKALMAKQKEQKGIIITDHMYRHLLEVSDYVYLMKDGKTMLIRDMNNLVLHGYINNYSD